MSALLEYSPAQHLFLAIKADFYNFILCMYLKNT